MQISALPDKVSEKFEEGVRLLHGCGHSRQQPAVSERPAEKRCAPQLLTTTQSASSNVTCNYKNPHDRVCFEYSRFA